MAATGMVLGAAYALWLCNRIICGLAKPYYLSAFSDLSRRNFLMCVPFVISTFMDRTYARQRLERQHGLVCTCLGQ